MPVKLITPRRFGDERGWFIESWSRRTLTGLGIEADFVQDNHSYSRPTFVLRGLHFQRPPSAQAKLVRCLRGRIWDVVVDLRRGSPTYARWVAAELSGATGTQIFVPVGFAHGLITLEGDTEVEYKVTDFYDPAAEDGIAWDDPDLALPWPLPPSMGPILSPKDAALGPLRDFESPFAYDGEPLGGLDS
ncbi:MAG: dTDP-4-dehydrorhamnose 3,5-epimerase [Caulobacteraceae bacterium]